MKHIFRCSKIRRNSKEPKNKVDDVKSHRLEDNKSEVYLEPTTGFLDLSRVIWREAEVLLLQEVLRNSESNSNQFVALGIVGTAGSGKTTLCQMVFNSEQVREHFFPRIWVSMTKQPGDDALSKVTVLKKMLTCLGDDEQIVTRLRDGEDVTILRDGEEIIEEKYKEDEIPGEIIEEKYKEDEIPRLVSRLHRQLVGKRYLIVLDDVSYANWDANEIEWYEKLDLHFDSSIHHRPERDNNFWSERLAFGLPKGYGGAVIVNGWSDKLVEKMVGKENLHLLPLTDEDCWAVFKKEADVDLQLDPQVEELRGFVVQRAGGHPLMAKMMGQCYREMQPQGTATEAADSSSSPTVKDTAIRPSNSSNGSITVQDTANHTKLT